MRLGLAWVGWGLKGAFAGGSGLAAVGLLLLVSVQIVDWAAGGLDGETGCRRRHLAGALGQQLVQG